eukprot:gene44584-59489_t
MSFNNSNGELEEEKYEYDDEEIDEDEEEIAIHPIIPFIDQFTNSVIFEPACGMGHIANVLTDHGFSNIIQHDLHTIHNEHKDYLDANIKDPSYDLLVINPPYCLKFEFLQKVYNSGKPFATLLPIDTMTTATGHEMFKRHGEFITSFYKRVVYITPNN